VSKLSNLLKNSEMKEVKKIKDRRAEAIFRFCATLHDLIDSLYEVMIDGTDLEEKEHIEEIVNTIQDLNKDR